MKRKNNKIYMDCAATTPVSKQVFDAMTPYFCENFGNANSLHSYGRDAAASLNTAREKIASLLGANSTEVYFTSGGVECLNWALKGIAHAKKDKGKHIITSAFEHHAHIKACKTLEEEGFEVTYLPVYEDGVVKSSDVEKAITEKTILISIMLANNEIGTIQPIEEISQIAKKHKIPLHTDAVQAVGTLDINVKNLGVDLMSISAHKFYGPKGIGVLFIRNGLKINKLIEGGFQERSMRGGTSNVAHAVGMAKALEDAIAGQEKNVAHIKKLSSYLNKRILAEIPHTTLVGHKTRRVPQINNFCFDFIEAESILFRLDMQGVCASSGSACASGSLEPSHVLMSLGIPIERAQGSMRFSINKNLSMKDIDQAVEIIKEVVADLREMSPLYPKDQTLFKEIKRNEKSV
ncbi:MAG: cysteine desulfurase [Firmicutes bacterium]|nr:cysteine desulfurase [Bacillota bacterium]